jgi:hypothetical protein
MTFAKYLAASTLLTTRNCAEGPYATHMPLKMTETILLIVL